jgi:hypothetical protein
MRALLPALGALCLTLWSPSAWSQVVCTTCEGCTNALATADAVVELGRDIAWSGEGACVTIRGTNTVFEGLEHAIRSRSAGRGEGVRVLANGANVLNVHVLDTQDGVVVDGAERVTVFHDSLQVRGVGVRASRARGLRVTRGLILGGAVGISFGALSNNACAADAAVTSPEAVVQRTTIDGAGVGVAACEALPVLVENTIRRGGVGVILGAPRAGEGAHANAPWDPCVCGAEFPGVRATSTLFYTSGCSSCQVHEAWMPDLQRASVDIVSRDSNNNHTEEQRRFDRYATRCATDLMDVLGIPGCVPNYACAATGRATKTRVGDRELNQAVTISSPEQLRAFADECRQAGAQGFSNDARCVRAALQRNEICSNRQGDIRAPGEGGRFGGVGNTCARAEGFHDGAAATGCERACPPSLSPTPSMPAARPEKASMGESARAPAPSFPAPVEDPAGSPPTAAPAGPTLPGAVPTPTPTPANAAPSTPREPGQGDNGPFAYVLAGLAALAVIGTLFRGRGGQPKS